MIASTRRDWATAQQRLRVVEAEKDCGSILDSLRSGEIDTHDAGQLLVLAVRSAEEDVHQLDVFVEAGDH